jgi:cystathionine beta-lyase
MKDDTLVTHAGRDPAAYDGAVNPPVYHVSTVIAQTVEELEAREKARFDGMTYGRSGTPTSFALEQAVAALEGGHRGIAVSSGAAAIVVTFCAFVKAGDHMLVPDNVYGPTRSRACDGILKRFGVETTYYDPLIGVDIAGLIRPETRLIYLESPGSLTFEVQDVPAIAAVARDRGVLTVFDNTWGAGVFFKPLRHDVDIVVHAATKYVVGHADAMLGVVVTRTEDQFKAVKWMANALGNCAGPDDCYLGLRGLRTITTRLRRHQETGLALARWLHQRPEVARVLHPALPDDPGHALWQRDFTGACGLFGVVLHRYPKAAVTAMLNGMKLFAMGHSWGGYESLMVPTEPAKLRSATEWAPPGPSLRIHAGLEDPDDLIADLEEGFARLNAAA